MHTCHIQEEEEKRNIRARNRNSSQESRNNRIHCHCDNYYRPKRPRTQILQLQSPHLQREIDNDKVEPKVSRIDRWLTSTRTNRSQKDRSIQGLPRQYAYQLLNIMLKRLVPVITVSRVRLHSYSTQETISSSLLRCSYRRTFCSISRPVTRHRGSVSESG